MVMRRQAALSPKLATLADLILGGAVCCCGVILLYFLYFYAWTHERSFTSPLGPLLYYGLPATLASLLLVAFRLEASRRLNVACLLVSIGGALYLAELVLTCAPALLARGAADPARQAQAFGVAFDPRDKRAVIHNLAQEHIHAVPNISPSLLLTQRRGR